jgi:hypothetical protein
MPSSATAQASTPAASAAPGAPAPALTPELIQTEIANTFDLETKLKNTVADLKAKRETGEIAFVAALAKELGIACVPLNIDTSPAFKSWKTADGTLEVKAKASEEALAAVQRHLDRLKDAQPDAMRTLLKSRRDALAAEVDDLNEQLKKLEHPAKHSKAA